MKFTQVVITFLFSLTSAAPSLAPVPDKTLKARATEICGQWDSVVTGTYTVYQNIWGEAAATSGSQCSTIDSLKGDVIAWSTAWTWLGASSSVKSYANVALTTTGVRISSISSIPTTWDYSYTGISIVADVSYDIFTSSTATGNNEFEIMVWLAAIGGAGPISSTGSPVSTPTINGVVWNLYSGPNGATTVYSFVAQSQVTSFSGDLLGFFTYLIASKGFSSSQYITTIEAGTEPFTGSDAVLSVSRYSVAISIGAVVATITTTSATPTSTKVSKTSASTSKQATKTSTPNKAFTTSTKATTTSTLVVATSTCGTIPIYYRCGGIGWTGSETCASGLTCKAKNAYYHQCL